LRSAISSAAASDFSAARGAAIRAPAAAASNRTHGVIRGVCRGVMLLLVSTPPTLVPKERGPGEADGERPGADVFEFIRSRAGSGIVPRVSKIFGGEWKSKGSGFIDSVEDPAASSAEAGVISGEKLITEGPKSFVALIGELVSRPMLVWREGGRERGERCPNPRAVLLLLRGPSGGRS
jgi:hypothetical protein